MADGSAHEAYGRIGDMLASAARRQTTSSALERVLRDTTELLHGAGVIVATHDEQLAAVGVDDVDNDEALRAEVHRVVASSANRGATCGWFITRHAVPGVDGLHVIVVRARDASSTGDDAVVRLLLGTVALVAGRVPDAAAAPPDLLAIRRNQLLEVLLQIQRRISHRAPLHDVLEAVVRGASMLMGGDAAVVHLIDPDEPDVLQPVAWTGLDDEENLTRVRLGEGASGRAAQEQRLVVFEHYAKGHGRMEHAIRIGIAAAMAAPVHTDGRTMGSLVTATRDTMRRYSAEDRSILLAFADNVSLALTDAHNLRRVDEALHDAVTGLPTRPLFLDRLAARLRSGVSDLAVLFCDLDRFKRVNDSLGHAAGDELLREVGRRLSSLLRTTDTAARLGGDEFAVLLDDIDGGGAEAISARIVEAFAAPFAVGGHVVRVGISIGLALAPAGQTINGEQLLSAADIAMYRAKRAGGSRLRRFEPTMAATAVTQLALETDLQHALPRGELHLVYQPVFDLWADRVAGLETLLRWTNPRRGRIAPTSFVPLAEESGLIVEIGRWVIGAACGTMRDWRRATGRDDVDLGVNLSARQFTDADLVPTIERALDAAGIDPARFVVELTENTLLAEVETAAARLQDIRALGVRVALDDFGTGYSSLGYLRQLPIDIVKLDRAFLPDTDDDREWALITAIIRMAADLGVVAVAEGIETERQLTRLLKIGCPDGQGYFLARPVPAGELAAAVDLRLPPTRADTQTVLER